MARSGSFEVMAGIPVYTDDWSSLALHEVGMIGHLFEDSVWKADP